MLLDVTAVAQKADLCVPDAMPMHLSWQIHRCKVVSWHLGCGVAKTALICCTCRLLSHMISLVGLAYNHTPLPAD